MKKMPKAIRRKKTPAVEAHPLQDAYAELDAEFDYKISELARLLEWHPKTVAGMIFESMNRWFWEGRTPLEILRAQYHWQTNFAYTSRKLKRETFLSNALQSYE